MSGNRGTALLLVMGLLAVVTISVGSFLSLLHASVDYTRREEARTRAVHAAEAGLEKAVAELCAGRSYTGETGTPVGDGTFSVSVAPGDGACTVISKGEGVVGGTTAGVTLEGRARIEGTQVVEYGWREVSL